MPVENGNREPGARARRVLAADPRRAGLLVRVPPPNRFAMSRTTASRTAERSLSARAETQAGSAWKAVHFFSRSASDSQAMR